MFKQHCSNIDPGLFCYGASVLRITENIGKGILLSLLEIPYGNWTKKVVMVKVGDRGYVGDGDMCRFSRKKTFTLFF